MTTTSADINPEELLRMATLAPSSGARAKYATRGLSHTGTDRTTRAMLLRQLYLSHMEGQRFGDAVDVAQEMADLGVMPDVALQDLARGYLGLGLPTRAIEQLRRAGRVAPASRRAFHLWTLGSVLYFQGYHAQAVFAFARAARWGTTAKPLYQAQLALALLASGQTAENLSELREALEEAPCGQGYGRFVLGELAFRQGDRVAARQYLNTFVSRTEAGRIALRVGLASELERARELLSMLEGEVGLEP
jgi:tetratricopeptide (TPR) repeat protein